MRCEFRLPVAVIVVLAHASPAFALTHAPARVDLRSRFFTPARPLPAAAAMPSFKLERPNPYPGAASPVPIAPGARHADPPSPEPSPFRNPLHRMLMADL